MVYIRLPNNSIHVKAKKQLGENKIKERERGHILDAKSSSRAGGIYFWMAMSADENRCYSVLGLYPAMQAIY